MLTQSIFTIWTKYKKNSPQNIHKERVLQLTINKTTKLKDDVSDHQAFSVKTQIGVKKTCWRSIPRYVTNTLYEIAYKTIVRVSE